MDSLILSTSVTSQLLKPYSYNYCVVRGITITVMNFLGIMVVMYTDPVHVIEFDAMHNIWYCMEK